MKIALAVIVAALGLSAMPQGASAQIYPYSYPWCAQTGPMGSENCGFKTYDQCQAFVLGTHWQCVQNVNYRGPVEVAPRKRGHRENN
jgi:hypothetical protein